MKLNLQSIIGNNNYLRLRTLKSNIRNFFDLSNNFIGDFRLYIRDSTVFKLDNFSKIEAKIILHYHALEKGFLHEPKKPRFAKDRVLILNDYLARPEIIYAKDKSQINVAYKVMCKYYELHKIKNIDISDYFNDKQYEFYKEVLDNNYQNSFEGVLEFESEQFYDFTNSNFLEFSNSRKSIRNYTGEKISLNIIEDAVRLASNAPSVCNRQAANVYLVEDKIKIKEILNIQGGFRGYSENVSQLLILTENRNYFYTVGERNQLYIDGGIFLMNLLYALHYYKIANCPANWGKTHQDERRLTKYISLPNSQKIICLIPIGVANDQFRVCLSKRRDISEMFHKI